MLNTEIQSSLQTSLCDLHSIVWQVLEQYKTALHFAHRSNLEPTDATPRQLAQYVEPPLPLKKLSTTRFATIDGWIWGLRWMVASWMSRCFWPSITSWEESKIAMMLPRNSASYCFKVGNVLGSMVPDSCPSVGSNTRPVSEHCSVLWLPTSTGVLCSKPAGKWVIRKQCTFPLCGKKLIPFTLILSRWTGPDPDWIVFMPRFCSSGIWTR